MKSAGQQGRSAGGTRCGTSCAPERAERDRLAPASGRTRGSGTGLERTDKRVLRSRRVMVEAFERLLATKPYEAITVTDIAREADVDRKTFYKHFGSIDGLLAYMLDRHVEEIVNNTHALLFHNGELVEQGLDRRLHTFFDVVNVSIMRNIALNRRVFECVPFELLLSCVKSSMLEELHRYDALPREMPENLVEYCLSFVFGGILSAYRHWIVSDSDVPIETVSCAASALVTRMIASIEFPEEGTGSILSA